MSQAGCLRSGSARCICGTKEHAREEEPRCGAQGRRLTEVGHAVALLQHLQRSRGGVFDDVRQLIPAHGQGRVRVIQLVQPLHLRTREADQIMAALK